MPFPQPPSGDPLNVGDFDMSPSKFFSMQTKTNVSQVIIEKLSSIENILKAQLIMNSKWFTMEADRRQDVAFEAAKSQKVDKSQAFERVTTVADSLYTGLLSALAILFALLYPKIAAIVGHIGEIILGLKAQLLRDIINPIKEKIKTFKNFIEGIHLKGITKGLGRVGEFIKMFGNFIGKVALLIPGMGKLMRFLPFLGQLMMIVDFINGFLVGLSGNGNLFTTLREGILNIGNELMKFVVHITSGLLKYLGFDDAGKWVEKNGITFVNDVVGFARELIDGVANVIISLFNITKTAIKGLLNKTAGLLSSIGMTSAADTLTEAANSGFLNSKVESPTDAGNTVTPKTTNLFKGNAFEFFNVFKDDLLGENGIGSILAAKNRKEEDASFTSPYEWFDKWSAQLQRDAIARGISSPSGRKDENSFGTWFNSTVNQASDSLNNWMMKGSYAALEAQEKELAALHQADVNLRRGGSRFAPIGEPIVIAPQTSSNISTSNMNVHQTVGSQLSTRNQDSVLTNLFSGNVYFPE